MSKENPRQALNFSNRKRIFEDVRRVVVKLGTRVVTVHDNELNVKLIQRLAQEVAQLHNYGVQVAIVSSGAVGAGMGRLGLRERPHRIPELMATAAVGQGLLMNAYKLAFCQHNLATGQVLLTAEDLDDRMRYVNARNTLESLFDFGAVPIINENDSVAVEEVKVGDNDRISALVSHLIDANLLVILTDVNGLYSEDPTLNGSAELIPQVVEITPELIAQAGKAGSNVSLGGMRTKLQAAESVTRGGRIMVIANGYTSRITEILDGKEVGTVFLPAVDRLTDRKLWIANSRKKGAIIVDGATVEEISVRGKDLRAFGVLEVVGDFEAWELIGVDNNNRVEVARGVVRYSSEEIREIQEKSSSKIVSACAHLEDCPVIHRDDIVVL